MRNLKWLNKCKKHLPTICVVVSALSGAAALYFTGRATVKAVRKYDKLKAEDAAITPKVIIKQFVPYYIPAIGFGAVSLACNIAGNKIHANRNRVLSIAAVSAAETLKDFKYKTKELVGEDTVKEIENKQALDAKVIGAKGLFDEMIRVYDVATGIKIETTYKKLYEAEAEVNARLSDSVWANLSMTLRDFYRFLGIDEKDVRDLYFGDRIWDVSYMFENWESNWVTFTHEEMYDRDGTPMVILRYSPEPEYDHVMRENGWE